MNKNNISENLENIAMKIAKPLTKFSAMPGVSAVIEGVSSNMNLFIIGGVFMIMFVLSSSFATGTERALLPFLEPYANNFLQVNNFTIGMIGLLSSITISSKYAKKVDVDNTTAVTLSFLVFMILSNWGVVDGSIDVSSFGAKGLILAMFSSVLSVKLYKYFIDKNLTIKLPNSVPPAVGSSFAALIPSLIIVTVCWLVRNIMNFDVIGALYNIVVPFFSASETVTWFGIEGFLNSLFWSVGIHGGNMLDTILASVQNTFLSENAAALASGSSLTQLPHWFSGARVGFSFINYWPLFIFMLTSKNKSFKKMLPVMLVPALFNITEPLYFGLPIVLNPYLMVPFIITQVICFVGLAFATSTGIVATRVATYIPWALPFPLQHFIAFNGELSIFLVDIVLLVICAIIWLPFWKAFEKSELEREKNND